MTPDDRPCLRDVVRIPVAREDGEDIVLVDPMQISESFAVDAEFGPLLDLLRGDRSVAQIRQSLMMRPSGPRVELVDLVEFCTALEEGAWLDDDHFRERWAEIHAEFLEAPERAPTMGDVLYPRDPDALAEALNSTWPRPPIAPLAGSNDVAAIITPHQPLERWGSLAAALRLPRRDQVDAVVLLGTDHQRGLLPFALCRKPFATPLGPIPVSPLADRLADDLPWLEREEIRHRHALSLELPCVLLRWAYGEDAPPIIPLLCGAAPDEDSDKVDALLGALEELGARSRLMLWASAELGHAGPGFGTPRAAQTDLVDADRALVNALRSGQALAVERACRDAAVHRASGAATLVTLARLLPLDVRVGALEYAAIEVGGAEGEDDGDGAGRDWSGAVVAHYKT